MGIFSLVGAYDISVGGNGEYRLMPQFLEEQLSFGFSLLPVLIGLFGLVAIITACCAHKNADFSADMIKLDKNKKFNWSIFKGQYFNLLRSSAIGTFVGMLPGIGGSAASVLAYTQQKNISKNPEMMGKGAPEGIITSESANNGLTRWCVNTTVIFGYSRGFNHRCSYWCIYTTGYSGWLFIYQ